MSGGNVLTIPCPTATTGGAAAGLCIDVELTCFDSGPSPLLLYTLFDCDPGSPTSGQILASDYRDPNNPTVVVIPTGSVAPCANAQLQPAAEYLCDDNGLFIRVAVMSGTGSIVGTPLDFDLSGAPYVAVGTVARCVIDHQDHILIDAGGPFIRRVTITNGVATFADFELDGVTPYATTAPVTIPEFDQILLCDLDANGIATPFLQVMGANGVIISQLDPATGTAYTPSGTVGFCDAREIVQETLCDYDALAGERIAEFVRRWVIDTNTNTVVVGPNDFELDGSTPYVIVGSETRQCQNEVGCDNDPCVPATISSTPGLGGNNPVSSIQLDPPLTNPGTSWKFDIFDNNSLGLLGPTGALTVWLRSGPGGTLPPPDEIFVWRQGQGGPTLSGVQAATALWQGTPLDIIIPGWAVTNAVFAAGDLFLNLWVDLELDNPQLCDLDTLILDVANFPGVDIQSMIDAVDIYLVDALANLANASAPFVLEGAGPGNGESFDIYALTTGNPIPADSVVLCKTVVQSTVCFDGEDQPLIQVAGINSSGQTVFQFFKSILTGAIVAPEGDPRDCTAEALDRFEAYCGTCTLQTPHANPAITGTQFQLSAIDASPATSFAHLIQDGNTNISAVICDFLLTANPQDVLSVPLTGGLVGVNVMVIPRWMVDTFDCSTPGEVFFNINQNLPHPDECPGFPPGWTIWRGVPTPATNSFTNLFNNTVTGTFTAMNLTNPATISEFSNLFGGPGLRVIDCCVDAEIIQLCDTQATGAVVGFFRNMVHLCEGTPSAQADFELDGVTPYVPTGTVDLCLASTMTTCEEDQCLGVNVDPIVSYTTGAPNGSISNPNFAAPFSVTLNYPNDIQLANDIETCVLGGGFFVGLINTLFGSFNYAFGGAGLTNLVNSGTGVLTFDFEPQVSLAQLAIDCPAAVAALTAPLQDIEALLGFAAFFGPPGLNILTDMTGSCNRLVTGPVDVAAQRVVVCSTAATAFDAHGEQQTGVAPIIPAATLEVRSFTVSVERGRAQINLANGDVITLRARSSRTWNASRLPNSILGLTANADFDIIWEEAL